MAKVLSKKMIEKASDQELAELAAVWIKKWHIKKLPIARYGCYDHWFDEENKLVCAKCEWSPAQNIGQAWETIGKIQELALEDMFNYILQGTLYSQLTARDVVIAALLAVMEG